MSSPFLYDWFCISDWFWHYNWLWYHSHQSSLSHHLLLQGSLGWTKLSRGTGKLLHTSHAQSQITPAWYKLHWQKWDKWIIFKQWTPPHSFVYKTWLIPRKAYIANTKVGPLGRGAKKKKTSDGVWTGGRESGPSLNHYSEFWYFCVVLEKNS